MRVLVLGGCGFIGSHAVDALVAAGHDVRVVSRRAEIWRAPVPGVEYRHIDYRDRDLLAKALTDRDAVFHMISATTPGSGDLNPGIDVRDNLAPSLALLELMQDAGVRRLVHLSSGGTVYGFARQLPVPEDHPLRPINSYGIVKVALESYIDLFCRTRGLSAVILRPSNSYGARQGGVGASGVVNTLLRAAAFREPVSIWGDGSIVRDYLHVTDLVRLAILALESGISGVFNAGTGIGTSLNDLVRLVSDVSGTTLDLTFGRTRSVDVPANVLDITRVRSDLSWEPHIALRDGLAMTLDWIRHAKAIA